MKILVTRHGQTDWNLLKKVQGHQDIELNENGRNQAEKTRDSLSNEKIDLIITSPLKRAKETAEIINRNFNVNIIEDIRLIERNLGRNSGLTKDEIKKLKEVHQEIKYIWDYEKNIEFNGIERMHDMGKRVYDFLYEIIQKYSGKNILLVTHGGVSVFIECYFKKYPLEELHDRSVITGLDNCEVATYEV